MVKKKKVSTEIEEYKPFFNDYNKKLNIYTVKTSLRSILIDYDNNFNIINQLVLDSNEYVIQTYQFMRLYFLYCFHNDLEFITIDKDSVLYFMRTLGIRDNRGVKSDNNDLEDKLNIFYQNEFYPLILKPKFSLINKTYLIPYVAEEISTSFKNNIQMHFIKRFRNFLNIIQPKIKIYTNKKGKDLDKEKKRNFNLVKNTNLNDDIENSCPIEYKKFALKIRNNFLPIEYEKSFYYDCKKECNLNIYLKIMIKMNLEIEQYNNRIKRRIKRIRGNKSKQQRKKKTLRTMVKKLFQIMPLRNNIIPHYTTFDKSFIKTYFKEKGKSKFIKDEDEKEIWSRILNIEHKIFKTHERKGYRMSSLSTDGIGVSITFKKCGLSKCKNLDNEKENIYVEDLNDDDLEILKTKKLVSLDPGSKGICLLDESKNNSDKYKRKMRNNNLNYNTIQRRKESMRKRNNYILNVEKENNYIIQKENTLSDYDSKTVYYEKFKDFIREKHKVNNLVSNFYQNKLFRKLKFRTHIYLRKSEDKFLNNIEKTYGKKEDITIIYGDWSNPKHMKHLAPSSNLGLKRLIEKKYKVLMIDEYCTSKLCSKCNKELTHYKMSKKDIINYQNKNKKELKSKNKHRLLVCSGCCSSENKIKTFWNRDVNACLNMLKLTQQWINTKSRNVLFSRNQQIKTLTDNR
jgi:hypothetical protein